MRSFLVFAAYALASVSAGAQPPAPVVVIEGCLREADVREAATAPAAPPLRSHAVAGRSAAHAAEQPRLYLLTDARPAGAPAPVGTAGVATTRNDDGSIVRSDPARTPRTYALLATGDLLVRLVGRRVEVEGTMWAPARVSEGQTATDPATAGAADDLVGAADSARGTAALDRDGERLRVNRIREVAPTCARPPG